MSCSCHSNIFPKWTPLAVIAALAILIAIIAVVAPPDVADNNGEDNVAAADNENEPANDDNASPNPDENDAREEENDWQPPRFTERRRDRNAMVNHLERRYDFEDEKALAAMRNVPRHRFVRDQDSRRAYEDSPLPIGHGQTISQPFIVAEMTRLLMPALKPGAIVLEIGTGSGYQAAVLTEFTTNVYSIEIIGALAESAEDKLKELGYDIVKFKHGDGYYGWEEHAPFDAIIVTAAAGQIPPPLLEQLAPGGRMVIPVGPVYATQSLMIVDKDEDGRVTSREHMPVRFVPLIHEDPTAE